MKSNKKLRIQENMFRRKALPGLRSTGLFARSPILGLTIFLLGSLTFGILAYQLKSNGSLIQWDMTVAKTFRAMQEKAPWPLMEDMLLGCFLGKEVVILIGAILSAYFLYKRFWPEFTMVVIGLGGGGLIWYALSLYFDRPRPTDHLPVLQLSGPAFPSGPVPPRSVPIKLPTIWWLFVRGRNPEVSPTSATPVPRFPEMRLRAAGVVPPTVMPTAPVITTPSP